MEIVTLIVTRLNETYGKDLVGKTVYNEFPIQNYLKKGHTKFITIGFQFSLGNRDLTASRLC
jgi:hypothetical protein